MPRIPRPYSQTSNKENISPVKGTPIKSPKCSRVESGKVLTIYDNDPYLVLPPTVRAIATASPIAAGGLTWSRMQEYMHGNRYISRVTCLKSTGVCIEWKDVVPSRGKPRVVECAKCGAVIDLGPISIGIRAYLEHVEARHGVLVEEDDGNDADDEKEEEDEDSEDGEGDDQSDEED
ncbi:hypothetical protein NMY22_g3133 [Coprinellus aureogranulatus]|nr:hypothetical protein NMY22_g3133 [Coprinellus aureogranulatus]